VVGGLVAVAAPRARRRQRSRESPVGVVGLEAFEGAPCWEYDRGLDDSASASQPRE
jgi:hypothetical protein